MANKISPKIAFWCLPLVAGGYGLADGLAVYFLRYWNSPDAAALSFAGLCLLAIPTALVLNRLKVLAFPSKEI